MNSRPAINIDYGKRDKLQDAYIVVKLKFPPHKDRRDIIAILSSTKSFPIFLIKL